jgi:DNA-binding GntR family transcriptional regulator
MPYSTGPVVKALSPLAPKVESVSDLVYDAIVDAIVSGAIPAGGQLSEASLAGQLQVSKTPVREALLRLREVGLIDDRYLRGNRVVERSKELVRLAYDVRATLESGIARLAAERASADQARMLVDAAKQSLDAARHHDVPAFQESDARFHALAAEISDSERLASLAENASLLTRVLRESFAPTKGDATTCGRAHVQIASAVSRRAAAAAADAAFAHVKFVESLVERTLAAGEGETGGPLAHRRRGGRSGVPREAAVSQDVGTDGRTGARAGQWS